MDDKSLLACAETKEAITNEQAEASAELGWLTVPDQTEESQARFLVRPVASKEEAASVLKRLAQLETTPEIISGLVFEPYLKDPLSVPASVIWNPGRESNKPDGGPHQPGGDEEKPDEAAEKPKEELRPQQDTFPNVPEYVWNSLKKESQEDLAKKLVDYVVNRSDTAAYGSSFGDATLFAHLEAGERSGVAKNILEQRHSLRPEQVNIVTLANNFQEKRVNLMEKAVESAAEINEHLKKWRELSNHVVVLLVGSSIVAGVFVLLLFGLVFFERINGWEMAVLAFVFALMAVSPATLLLVGRPLKGLDEWSPSKQEKKPEEAPKEEPTKDTAKSEEKAGK